MISVGKVWKGEYQQSGVKHPMTFTHFEVPVSADGKLHIEGSDKGGEFEMRGSLFEGKVLLVRRYADASQSLFKGTYDANEHAIRGVWETDIGAPEEPFKMWTENV